MSMPGDAYLEGGPPTRTRMTRAISVASPPEEVWPWLAQFGRGAGWYSIDLLDNGSRSSARHLVSWIPEPRLGDAAAIGYLRHIEPGRGLTWWQPPLPFLGASTRLVMDMRVSAEGDGARLVFRVSADAAGRGPRLVMWIFQLIDSIMSRQTLLGIKQRAERYDPDAVDAAQIETGDRDQYQLYETIFASGDKAGVPGQEAAARWHHAAVQAGLLEVDQPAGNMALWR